MGSTYGQTYGIYNINQKVKGKTVKHFQLYFQSSENLSCQWSPKSMDKVNKKKEKSLVFPSNHHLSTNYLLFHMGSDT